MGRKLGRDIVHRWEGNPIITIDDLSFNCSDIRNAGAVKINNEYILLITIEMLEGSFSIFPARSKDGYNFEISSTPFLSPAKGGPFAIFEQSGTLDARITKMDDKYYVTYNAEGPHGFVIGLAETTNFITCKRIGIISEPDTKACVLFPEKIKNRYARLERPGAGESIWLSYSDDLIYWGYSERIMTPRGGFWDNNRVGPATQLLKVAEGWLLLYYGVKETSAGPLFRIGVAILDYRDPTKVIARSNVPILAPRELYERIGDIQNVIFSCGCVVEPDGEMKLYYGASNSCICVGTVRVSELVQTCFESQKEF